MSLKNYLTLSKPLVWLDVETANMAPPEQARICEFSFHMIYPDDRPDKIWGTLVNPGIPIHADTTRVHKIMDSDVADKPKFAQIAQNIAGGLKNVDFGGYNVKFDLRVLSGEFARCGITWTYLGACIIDPLRLWQVQMPRTLTDAVREFCGREPSEAHRASGDVQDVYDVLLGQFDRWKDLPRDVTKLSELCFPPDPDRLDDTGKFRWRDGKVIVTFGKNAGKALESLPKDYLQWVCGADFSEEVKQIAREALQGRYPKRIQ